MGIDNIRNVQGNSSRKPENTFDERLGFVKKADTEGAVTVPGQPVTGEVPAKSEKEYNGFFNEPQKIVTYADPSIKPVNTSDDEIDKPKSAALALQPLRLENYVGENHLSRDTTSTQIAFIMKNAIDELAGDPKALDMFVKLIDAENIGSPPPYDVVVKNIQAVMWRVVTPVMGYRYGDIQTEGPFAGTRKVIDIITKRNKTKKGKLVPQYSPFNGTTMINGKRRNAPLQKDSATYKLILSALGDVYTGKVSDTVNRATSYANVAASTDKSWQGGAARDQDGALVKGGGHAFFNATNGRFTQKGRRDAEIPKEWANWSSYMPTLIAQSANETGTSATLAALSGTKNDNVLIASR